MCSPAPTSLQTHKAKTLMLACTRVFVRTDVESKRTHVRVGHNVINMNIRKAQTGSTWSQFGAERGDLVHLKELVLNLQGFIASLKMKDQLVFFDH